MGSRLVKSEKDCTPPTDEGSGWFTTRPGPFVVLGETGAACSEGSSSTRPEPALRRGYAVYEAGASLRRGYVVYEAGAGLR
ncbi:MAG: hypothetical protein ABFD77_08645 [Thermotogota bacterium]